jgi:AcrR family transcriptional regulator
MDRRRDRAPRRVRADGERSRKAILKEATALASVIGLEGLSIGVLADRLGISKSGLYAHFGSKEQLEVATIAAAGEIFDDEVIQPSHAAPPGRARLVALCRAFLDHLERRTFPGGCFFAAAAAEFDSRSGRVRDEIAGRLKAWEATIEEIVRDARDAGEIDPDADVGQVAFEFQAMLVAANARFLMSGDARVLARARVGVEAVLGRYAGGASLVKQSARAARSRGRR